MLGQEDGLEGERKDLEKDAAREMRPCRRRWSGPVHCYAVARLR
jgi:hypothetical protein